MLRKEELNVVILYKNGLVQVGGEQFEWSTFVRKVEQLGVKVAWLEVQNKSSGVSWTSEDALRWPSFYSRVDVLLYRLNLAGGDYLQLRVWLDPFGDSISMEEVPRSAFETYMN